jgi:hypothetical protein
MSAICLTGEKNINFVHIPKSAGSSIYFWLKQHKGNSQAVEWHNSHPQASTLQVCNDNNFTFAAVRNPWDRAVSTFEYIKFKTPIAPKLFDHFYKTYQAVTGTEDLTFDLFVHYLQEFKINDSFWWNFSTNQCEWIQPSVDLVLKTENLEKEFVEIQDRLDVYEPLQILNRIEHPCYREYFNEETKKLIARKFEADIDRWQYTF